MSDHQMQNIFPLHFLTGFGKKSILDLLHRDKGSFMLVAVGKLWKKEAREDACGTSVGTPEPTR